MTPQTSHEWGRALARVSPDGPTPDAMEWDRLIAAREAWKQAQPAICHGPGCHRPVIGRPGQLYCGRHCSVRSTRQRKAKRLKAGRPKVTTDALV
jgi:hypothetical protein